jgi:hypothetical protein
VQPGIPRPHQLAALGDGRKALKILLDAGFHVVVDRTLLGREVGGRDQRQTHKISPCFEEWFAPAIV